MSTDSPRSPAPPSTESWRTVAILAVAMALGASNGPLITLSGGIVGQALAPSPLLATLPVTALILGVACSAVPAALLMGRIGRRRGFMLGATIGSGGAMIAAAAITAGSFAAFCAATFVLGTAAAFGQQYRFAAAESVAAHRAGRAVSFVLIGGIVAGALGPEIGRRGRQLLDAEFSGAFLIAAAIQAIVVLLVAAIRSPNAAATVSIDRDPVSVTTLLRRPAFLLALLAGATAYAAMSFLMTATPISMHVMDGHSLDDTARVIQSHVIAMYVPSLASGLLVDRLGERTMMVAGTIALVMCSAVGASSHSVGAYWTALVLLGIGWNLLFIGGTVLLTRSYAPSERFRAQAVNDLAVFGSQACASLASGAVLHRLGWTAANLIVVPVVIAMMGAIAALRVARRTPAVTGAGASPTTAE